MKSAVEAKKKKFNVQKLVLCGLFAALISIGAFIRIPMAFLAFSLQTMFVSLSGMLLGKKWGPVAVLIYIVLGLAGLPVFSEGGGPGYVLMPSFGFLIGFIFYSFFTGKLTEKLEKPKFSRLIVVQLPGLFLMYAIALPYYYLICQAYLNNGMGVDALLYYCFVLMLPGEAIKCLLSAWLGQRLLPVLRQRT